jgi:phage terminase large subunit-like protein
VAARKETRGQRVIRFIETFCLTPEGALVGQPIRLLPFQKKFIRDIFDRPANRRCRRALLSIARKNGKSALIACLVLAFLVGPEATLNASIIAGARSRDQAAVIFELAAKMVRLSPVLAPLIKVVPSTKELFGKEMGTHFRAISADAANAHGKSPRIAILDEVGQIAAPTDPFVDAIETSQGAHADPLLIAISTQAPSDAALFSQWIDDATRSGDPHTVCHVYAAPEGCTLDDPAAWAAANPALGAFRSKADLKTLVEKAQRLPQEEARVRNLFLNQRIAQERVWLAPTIWKANSAKPDLDILRRAERLALALDLSQRTDLTAAVLAAKDPDGFVHLLPYAFTPVVGIEQRSLRDKTPYDLWLKQGLLIGCPDATISYDFVAEWLKLEFDHQGFEPTDVVFDRWRIDQFKQAARAVSFAQGAVWQPVGQGFKDFSPRMESFETVLLNEKLRHGAHPLLNLGAAGARAVADPAHNRKLDKLKSTSRIDTLVAGVMAVHAVTEGATSSTFDVEALIG